ncbi:AAA-ATPase At3g50940 [Nicotiana tabacum]|uniref:AAA-ATPase At3g50940 n=1 Tax=Nicotiana tabacum TaxID=4097 RepID=A0A1S3YKX4_TOBAC|nr:AAA-ATPase At3g50940-like [Nicotiana tomentosiformis]XP_016452901.1 PREDICTED: AAA-ATPase At3g50940-like [Nicotiana tabacum]
MAPELDMANVKAVVSTVASVAATAMLVRSIANDFIPKEFRSYIFDSFPDIFRRFSSQFTVLIHEFQGPSPNLVFEAVEVYLGTIANSSAKSIRLGKTENDKNLVITMDKDEEIIDVFENIKVTWRMECRRIESGSQNDEIKDMIAALSSELRCYELSFHKKHKEMVMKSYLPYIMERSKATKEESRAIKLYSNFRNWGSDGMNLEHPMTFDTLAMEEEIKNVLIDDLASFVKGKEYYNRIGKAWKRGYLLYGPPGTGKSSLIAAMANHLNYDIYDLDLTEVRSNSNLRSLLLGMSGRSILVIEDIDCSIKLENREKEEEKENKHNRVTLSGILNFLDGIWSCCGEERIIVVTTNHIDKLDAALLRPGRMDMHIYMSYCKLSSFKQLVFNYLRIQEHKLFDKIGQLLEAVEVTPAEVAGELLKSTNPNISLQSLIEFLQNKIAENKMKAEMDLTLQNEKPEEEPKDTTNSESTLDSSEDLTHVVNL